MSYFLDLTADKENSFEPIPAGIYNMIVSDVEDTATSKGDRRLRMTFTITDGEYVGRKIFEGYNLTGNEKAVQISRGQLKALWKCAGHDAFVINHPSEFQNIEIAASVKIQPAKDGYDAKNTISSFKPKQKQADTTAVPF